MKYGTSYVGVGTYLREHVHAGFVADVCTKPAAWAGGDEDAGVDAVIIDILAFRVLHGFMH